MSDKTDSEEKNRFTELLEQLAEKTESEKSLSDYKSLLDSLDDDDSEIPATIPFPYGGSSDFGKWVTEAQSRTSGWRSTAAPF